MDDDEVDPDLAADIEMMARQQEMEGDLDAVEAYGRRFPETWTGVMFDDDRVIALFTDPDPHRQAIAELVSHPDRVEVRAAPRSERDLDEIMAGVQRHLAASTGDWVSYGPDMGNAVVVELHGRAEELAGKLHEEFGDAVQVTLGMHPYPPRDDWGAVGPEPAPTPEGQVSGLSVRAVPDSDVVCAGDDITGHVVVHNSRDRELSVHTGAHLSGDVIRDGHVVGTREGLDDLVALLLRLEPGASTTVAFVAGTDSRDPRVGSLLVPGRYDLVVSVGLFEVNGGLEDGALLVTEPVPIKIVARS